MDNFDGIYVGLYSSGVENEIRTPLTNEKMPYLIMQRLTVSKFTNVNLVPFSGGVFNPPQYPTVNPFITPANSSRR